MPLEKRYKALVKEPELHALWEELGIYRFVGDEISPIYSIDTPPATVSGHLHLGHVYSYSQTDFLARFWRMNGYDVFYPMGFDDNGLPTERLVERSLGVESRSMARDEFIQKCLVISEEFGQEYRDLWERIGLSIDWRYTYRTIDEKSRRISQASFVDLFQKHLVYRDLAPTIWCPTCQTALAQADLDDLARQKDFYTLAFRLEDGSTLPIATTRPELLAACVAIFIHPEDESHRHLLGKNAIVPLFNQEVPIYEDSEVDQTKGTGVVMCCTFGDAADIQWWRTHGLSLRVILDTSGNLSKVAGEFADLPVDLAHKEIVKVLSAKGLILEQEKIEQSVRVHERCDTPVEFLVTNQWFIRILDFKAKFLEATDKITWHPEYMKRRYEQWVENLNMDWLISRQRHYGIPFPVWYCDACGEPLLADLSQLPVDPLRDQPQKKCACGGSSFTPERDVMDTWATSSLTPQIACGWLSDEDLYHRTYPMSLRSQAHEIIRTWAFYTIVKSIHHFDKLPWSDVAISGWGLAPAGSGKISKSRGGGPVSPDNMIERYSADAVRYWAASTGLGKDAIINEDKIIAGSRLMTKLWNVARFSQKFITGYQPPADVFPSFPLDRWILQRSQSVVDKATQAFLHYDYVSAKNEVEALFWHDMADNYLELVKFRLYGAAGLEKESAQATLYQLLLTVLKLIAPFLPHVTDVIYQELFAKVEGSNSIHVSGWPERQEIAYDDPIEQFGQTILQILTAVRRYKSEHQLPLSSNPGLLQLKVAESWVGEHINKSIVDLRSATRSKDINVVEKFSPTSKILLEDGLISVGLLVQDGSQD